MSTSIFEPKETKVIQQNVLDLLASMSQPFREHLMHSFMWTEEKLNDYLQKDLTLSGPELKDAYSHLDSLLSRIESFAVDKSTKSFPTYDHWVDTEYRQYKASLTEDREDIARLVDEGGVVNPGPTSPVDTMANDSLAHYNQVKSDFELVQHRSDEAIALMQLPSFKVLKRLAEKMNQMIRDDIKK